MARRHGMLGEWVDSRGAVWAMLREISRTVLPARERRRGLEAS
jgi:hypothetical protein